MFIGVVGINYKTAPVEIRERMSLSKPQIKARAQRLKEYVELEGIVILSTCNRTEFYFAAQDREKGQETVLQFIAEYTGCTVDNIKEYIYCEELRQGVYHLLRVASGLDSMILGESEILGQVEDAYNCARDCGISNNVLNTLFQKAINVGKKVRTETSIDHYAVSVGSAAVELSKNLFGKLQGKTVLVLGAGETSELTLRHLVSNGVSTVVVANRTYEKAKRLAEEFGGQAVRLSEYTSFLQEADIVISCTAAPHYLLEVEDVASALQSRQESPLLFIDIAVPRDIHPEVGKLPGISLYDIDDLQHVVQKNLDERKKEAVKAQKIVEEEVEEFLRWFESLKVIPTIVSLQEKANEIKEKELEKTFRKLGKVTEKEEKIIGSLANSIINKFLYEPIINLKEYAPLEKGPVYSEAIEQLFNLRKHVAEELKS